MNTIETKMNKKKPMSFLVLNWKIYKKKTLKILKKKWFKKPKLCNYFRVRIIEQIVNFIKLNYQIYPKNFFLFLFLNGSPVSFSQYFQDSQSHESRIKKNVKIILKIWEENYRMQRIHKEAEIFKTSFVLKNTSNNFNSIFFIIYILSKKLGPIEANIFNLISENHFLLDKPDVGINLNMCKKLNCCLNFLAFGKKYQILRFLAYFSNGFYGEPDENLIKIIYCNKFLQLLSNLFWLNKFNKEFFIKAIDVKPTIIKQSVLMDRVLKRCGSCSGMFRSAFSNCVLCGKKFLL
jgi:hypothetical protein